MQACPEDEKNWETLSPVKKRYYYNRRAYLKRKNPNYEKGMEFRPKERLADDMKEYGKKYRENNREKFQSYSKKYYRKQKTKKLFRKVMAELLSR